MRYVLRTLLMVLAIGPPMLAGAWLAIEASRRPVPPPEPFSTQIGSRY